MDYTSITLGTLLSFKDETIRRNAMSILKRLPDALTECHLDTDPCIALGKQYAKASEARATDADRAAALHPACGACTGTSSLGHNH